MKARLWPIGAALVAALTASQACVFELAEVVEPTGGGGGTGGSSGNAGGVPGGWWDESFQRRMRLSFDVEESVDEAILPVFLDDSRIDYATAEPGGADLRLVDGDGVTELPYEIERWDPAGGSLLWVRVPAVEPDDHLWLYWSNPGLPSGQTPGAVWMGYEGVVHMSDPLEGNGTTIRNRGSGPDLIAMGLTPDNEVDGRLGPAYRFDAQPTGQSISSQSDSPFAVPVDGQATIEGWFQWDGVTESFLAEHEGCCLGWAVRLQADADLQTSWGIADCCDAGSDYASGAAALPGGVGDTDWHHFVVIYDRQAGTSEIFIDGQASGGVTTIPAAGSFIPQGKYRIGADFSGDNSFGGVIDESRFAPFRYEVARIRLYDRAARDVVIGYGQTEALP